MMSIITGLSGNEIYCLALKGYRPGNIVVGNSIYSLGFVRSIGTSMKFMLGGELAQVTQLRIASETTSYSWHRVYNLKIRLISNNMDFHEKVLRTRCRRGNDNFL